MSGVVQHQPRANAVSDPQLLLPMPSRTSRQPGAGPGSGPPGSPSAHDALAEAVVPRPDLVHTLAHDLRAGRNVLLAGREGSGKTFLLRELERELSRRGADCVYVATGSSFKPLVVSIAEALHGLGRLSIDGVDTDGEWDQVAGRLTRTAVDKLTPSVIACLVNSESLHRKLVLLLDDFDKPWPRYAPYLKQVFEAVTTVVASASADTPRLAPFRRYFGRILPVPALTHREARSLAAQLYDAFEVNSPDAEAFLKKAVLLADGSPLACGSSCRTPAASAW
ncbi:MAG: AAA family ATPase [Acidobacteria bacterium]|nr:AAA family ATPase [Acidobacteriota bacterium]